MKSFKADLCGAYVKLTDTFMILLTDYLKLSTVKCVEQSVTTYTSVLV